MCSSDLTTGGKESRTDDSGYCVQDIGKGMMAIDGTKIALLLLGCAVEVCKILSDKMDG